MTSLKGANGVPTARSDIYHRGNAGWPTGGDTYGHGGLIVLVGVTSHQGGRESRPQGEGAQVSAVAGQRGRRDADSHNCRGTTRYGGWSGTGKRSAMKVACCVWGGADAKGLVNQYLGGCLLHLTHPGCFYRPDELSEAWS